MSVDNLITHLETGAAHTCHCWSITRHDSTVLGFTDHDAILSFEGTVFAPQTGLNAKALASSTGLSVNNTEAVGALTSDAITEADIFAGRYDAAEVVIWLVCWDNVEARKILFRGSLGEITRASGGFQAELLGLTAALNQQQGRSFLKNCSAALGDAQCGVRVEDVAYRLDYTVDREPKGQIFVLSDVVGFQPTWFEGGQITVLSGEAAGLKAMIKSDIGDSVRQLTLWNAIAAPIRVGDQIRLTAGCDKQPETCHEKFANFINFRGFPDIPGDDWLVSVPRSDQANAGGSIRR